MEKTEHRLTGRGSCHACIFCGSRVVPGSKTIGFVCRINPPVVQALVIPTPQGVGVQAIVMWPEVTADDWCAEFVANEN
jgi:hypothetical protein